MSRVVAGPASLMRLDAGRWFVDNRLDEDAIEAFRRWAADPMLSESLNRVAEDLSREDVMSIARRHDQRTSWLLFARRVDSSEPVGYVSLVVDPTNGVAAIELIIGEPSARGLAAMDSIAGAVGAWAFERQRMRKVTFGIRADNRVTARWLDRNAVLEGRLRGEMVLPDGRIVDRLIYGMMPDEWRRMHDRVKSSSEILREAVRHQHPPGARIGLRPAGN